MKSSALSQSISNAHPSRVRLLFQKYGINDTPGRRGINKGILLYKQPFLKDLYSIYNSSYNNFTDPIAQAGLTMPTEKKPVANTNDKKLTWDEFKTIYVTDAPAIAGTTLGLVETVRQIFNPYYYNPTTMPITQVDYEKMRTRRIIAISLIVIGILVLVLYLTRKK